MVKGSYLMIDDFTNIDPDGNSIRDLFHEKFQNFDYEVTSYFGIDGVVIRFFGIDKIND